MALEVVNAILEDRNRILQQLPADDRQALLAHGKKVALVRGMVLHRSREPIKHVYFPLEGMISLLAVMSTGDAIETGIVGREGVVGSTASNKNSLSFGQTMVPVNGIAWQIPALRYFDVYQASETLRRLVTRYQSVIIAQAQQSAACYALHKIDARLSRWLLQSRDVLGSDSIELTQEFLSHMLGVQRSSVSTAARALQAASLISYARGKVQIVDPKGLKACACECYSAIRDKIAAECPEA